MGFGLLFIGYAMTYLMSLNSFGFLFRLTGCAVMLAGISRLADYERKFFHAHLAVIIMTVSAFAESLAYLFFDFFGENAGNICYSVFLVLTVVFHFLIYRAVHKISKDVGVKKIELNSVRYAVFASVELLLLAAVLFFWYFGVPFTKYIVMAAMLYPFIIIVLNLALFYSCYKNICEEGDEEALRKRSRIPFLNKLFDASEKREQEIFDKTKSYAEKRIADDLEKKKNKKKHKKKRR